MFKIVITFLGIMLSSGVLADTINTTALNTGVVIGLSVGPTWVSGNKTQTINLQPDIVKTYTANPINNVIPSLELFVGGQKPIITHFVPHSLLGQLGLSIVEAGHANLKGDIWEDANSSFNNSSYQYKINHMAVALKGRLVGDFNYFFQPYISGSVGIGFNRAYDFTITPTISEEVPSPTFASNTTASFSFALGIGLQKAVTENVQVAIGYEFADWGKSSLSPAAGQTTNQGPMLNHLYAQTLQFSLFYA